MLVAPKFDGDDDDALQWAQHDVYGRAVGIILSEARTRLSSVENLLEGSSELSLSVSTGRFDHHVLQDAHDLLAAQWRAESRLIHPRLPGTGQPGSDLIAAWLIWLGNWVRRCEPALASAILQVAYAAPPADHSYEVALLSHLERDLAAAVHRMKTTP